MKTISIVMPLYNARSTLPDVLPPLLEALEAGEVQEVVVVDDNSTDDSPDTCRSHGLKVLRTAENSGPGSARNLGVEEATGEIVLFIDSDVVMRPEVPAIVREAFESRPDVGAVFGSYDDDPAVRTLVSQYMNLRHHYIHQNGKEQAETFWAGCGAVDREVYRAVGGYDAEKYPYPSIEDIELGNRLRKAGKLILLRKAMLCKHLKGWTLKNMVHTDVFRRAIPWSRLMLEPGYDVDDLNVGGGERVKALVAGGFWLSLAIAPFRHEALWAAGLFLVLAFLANAGFFLLVLRRAGIFHMFAAVLLHQLYYIYSSVAYVYCVLEARFKGSAAPA